MNLSDCLNSGLLFSYSSCPLCQWILVLINTLSRAEWYKLLWTLQGRGEIRWMYIRKLCVQVLCATSSLVSHSQYAFFFSSKSAPVRGGIMLHTHTFSGTVFKAYVQVGYNFHSKIFYQALSYMNKCNINIKNIKPSQKVQMDVYWPYININYTVNRTCRQHTAHFAQSTNYQSGDHYKELLSK